MTHIRGVSLHMTSALKSVSYIVAAVAATSPRDLYCAVPFSNFFESSCVLSPASALLSCRHSRHPPPTPGGGALPLPLSGRDGLFLSFLFSFTCSGFSGFSLRGLTLKRRECCYSDFKCIETSVMVDCCAIFLYLFLRAAF